MNDTGAFIWTKLSDGATPAEAAVALVEAFEVSPR
jgi:hypothetical protein